MPRPLLILAALAALWYLFGQQGGLPTAGGSAGFGDGARATPAAPAIVNGGAGAAAKGLSP